MKAIVQEKLNEERFDVSNGDTERPVKMWIAFSSNSMQPDARVEKMRSQSGRFFVFVFQIDNLSAKRCLWLEYVGI